MIGFVLLLSLKYQVNKQVEYARFYSGGLKKKDLCLFLLHQSANTPVTPLQLD